MMENDWLKDIHNRMADFEMEEPQGLWEDICAAETEGTKLPVARSTRSKRIGIVSGIAAVGLLLLGIFLHGNNDNGNALEERPSEKTMIAKDNTKEMSDGQQAENRSDKTNVQTMEKHSEEHLLTENKPIEVKSIGCICNKMNGTLAKTEQVDISHTTTDTVSLLALANNDSPSYKEAAHQNSTDHKHREEATRGYEYYAQTETSANKPSRFTVGFATAGGIGADNRQLFQGEMMAVASTLGESGWHGSPLLGIMALNKGADTERKVRHHSPIRTGLSLAYRLNDRWSLESGVTYALVGSDIHEGNNDNFVKETQRLHYVGIPVGVRYRICSWKKLAVYLSSNVLAEKCVSGQTHRKYFISGNVNGEEETTNIASHPMQWSLGAKAGVEYDLNNQFSVYAEPGCIYYFNDNSSLETVFKERPLDFNLNLGVRLTVGK